MDKSDYRVAHRLNKCFKFSCGVRTRKWMEALSDSNGITAVGMEVRRASHASTLNILILDK